MLDVFAGDFDVFDSVVVFQGLFHLIEEGHGLAQIQEFGLVSSGLEAVVFVEEFFGVGIHDGIGFQQALEGVMLANDSFFVGLVFQPLQGVRFALHRQYPAGLFAGFVHAQYEKAGLCFGVDFGIGGRLEYRTASFDVAGLALTTGNGLLSEIPFGDERSYRVGVFDSCRFLQCQQFVFEGLHVEERLVGNRGCTDNRFGRHQLQGFILQGGFTGPGRAQNEDVQRLFHQSGGCRQIAHEFIMFLPDDSQCFVIFEDGLEDIARSHFNGVIVVVEFESYTVHGLFSYCSGGLSAKFIGVSFGNIELLSNASEGIALFPELDCLLVDVQAFRSSQCFPL